MQKEKLGFRDGTYSAWHRPDSIKRFVSPVIAAQLTLIDVDVVLWIECDKTQYPIALIETARDVGQSQKCSYITRNLAERANLPALVVLYTPEKFSSNPADNRFQDIASFRVRRICPNEEDEWKQYLPEEYANMLAKMREWAVAHIDKQVLTKTEIERLLNLCNFAKKGYEEYAYDLPNIREKLLAMKRFAKE